MPTSSQNIVALLERAHSAQQRGELADAMVLASDALMLQPAAEETLALVEGIARQAADPLLLAPLSVSPALTACRARVLALQGELLWAITLVRHVVTAVPELHCVPWVRDWLTPAAIHRLGLDELKGELVAFVKLWSSLPPGLDATDARLGNVRATAEIVAQVRREFPDEAPLYAAEVLLRRRLGEPSATLLLAREAAARFADDWSALVSAATAERDAKHPEESLAYARRALALAPSDGSPLHDAAWAYVEAERPSEAAALFEELSEDYPDYPLAR